jgi:hypothetical protein
MAMESSGFLSAVKKGLMSKLERFTGIYGGIFGWRSLKRKRLQKRLQKKEVAREKRLARLAREFKGRLMLEPLEERIVPAVAAIGPGEFALINFSAWGLDGATYGIIANPGTSGDNTDDVIEAGESWFAVDVTPGPNAPEEVDTLDAIHLLTNTDTNNDVFDTIVLTNIRVPNLDSGSVHVRDTVNATLVTGLDFGPDPNLGDTTLQVTFGGITFTIANAFDGYVSGNFTEIEDTQATTDPAFQLNQFEEVNGHASDVGQANCGDTDHGVVNFVERDAIGSVNDSHPATTELDPFAGIDTRVSDKDAGDVGVLGDVKLKGGADSNTNNTTGGVLGGRVDASGNLLTTVAYTDTTATDRLMVDMGYGIWAHDGSILDSTGFNPAVAGSAFNFQTPYAQGNSGDILAENIGILKAAYDIGDIETAGGLPGSTIRAGNQWDPYIPTLPNADLRADGHERVERIAAVIAGGEIEVGFIRADDGIGSLIAGAAGIDGDVGSSQENLIVHANYDHNTNPQDMGIELIQAINGDVLFTTITTNDANTNNDRIVQAGTPDPYGYDLPQNRPTDIRGIYALAPDVDDNLRATIQGGSIWSDADLGPVVSGYVDSSVLPGADFNEFVWPFGDQEIGGRLVAWGAGILAEGTGDVFIAPGGIFADIRLWRATTHWTGPDDEWNTADDVVTPYLFNAWAGVDTTGTETADTGIVYRIEALQPDGSAAEDVTAAVFWDTSFNSPFFGPWYNPDLVIMSLDTASAPLPTVDPTTDLFNDDTVVNSQTDLYVTTSQIVTERLDEFARNVLGADLGSNADFVKLAQTADSDDLPDSEELMDLRGLDVDGPYMTPSPSAGGYTPVDGFTVNLETDLRNVVLETNFGNYSLGAIVRGHHRPGCVTSLAQRAG